MYAHYEHGKAGNEVKESKSDCEGKTLRKGGRFISKGYISNFNHFKLIVSDMTEAELKRSVRADGKLLPYWRRKF